MAVSEVAPTDGLVPVTNNEPRVRLAGRRDSTVKRLLAVSDAAAVLAALIVAIILSTRGAVGTRLLWGIAVVPVTVFLFKLYGLYDRDIKRMSHSTVDDIPWLFHAVLSGTLILWLYSKLAPLHQLDLVATVSFGTLSIGFVTACRFAVRLGAARWLTPEAALMVGSGPMARMLAEKLAAHPEYSARVVGILTPRSHDESRKDELPILGTPGDLQEVASLAGATRVIVSPGEIDEVELEELLRRCRSQSLKVSLLPQLSEVLGPAVEIDDVEGVTVLGVNPPWLPRSSRALKRSLDLAMAGTMLLFLVPLMALIAAAIKLDSRGPIFFRQTRVGRAGRRFRVVKFRTMCVDAEAQRAALLTQSKDPNWLHLEADPRVTRIGRILRLSSLDELPQLWNVVRGQMSMVGPRPLIEAEDEMVQGWGRGRLDLTPGITGYWQVLGRTRIPFEEMVKLDYLYVMNWSLWTDVRLMLRTLPTVLGRRGAN